MSRKHFFSIVFFICSFYLTLIPLSAQEEQGEIIIISERVGKEIDLEENDKFKLFEGIKGFQSAVYIKTSDGRYFLKITFQDDKTGEIKTSRTLQSEASIKNRGYYIDHFEEIQARKEEEERGGEIIIISERVGKEIDLEERDKYELFQNVKGFQSAVFIKLPDSRFILKIIYQDDQTGKLKFDRIQQSKESMNDIRYSIDRFGETEAHQDTIYQAPGTAWFVEFLGKPFPGINVDFRINKSSRFSLGINGYYYYEEESEEHDKIVVLDVMPNIVYYYLRGKKNNRFEIGAGLGVMPVWNKDYNFDSPIAFHSVIGYRYQKKDGLLFRIGLTFNKYDDLGLFFLGLSFGYSW